MFLTVIKGYLLFRMGNITNGHAHLWCSADDPMEGLARLIICDILSESILELAASLYSKGSPPDLQCPFW